jgi:starvation-inducible DNA-binding protein
MGHMHETRIDLPEVERKAIIDLLNTRLADTLDLYTQTKQAHWNVKGSDFIQLHELFDELASTLIDFVDMVAERVTTLGGTAMGTARMAANTSTLPEYPDDLIGGGDHVTALADRYGTYAASVRSAIDLADESGDKDTADLFTEVSRAVDKQLWFLEAHLQG